MARWRLARVPAAGAVVPAIAVALAVAACGAHGGPIASAQSGSQPAPGAVTFAKCMRRHGVPQFPDPGGPQPAGSSILIFDSWLPATVDIQAPAVRSALNTCMKPLLAAHPRRPVSAAQKAAALRLARCVRAHGVPSFPDPRFPGNRGIAVGPPPGVDPDSPALLHAQQVCGNP